jgi:hypothetical protein
LGHAKISRAGKKNLRMAANGKTKTNGGAKGKAVQAHAEEEHGYEFLGP